MVHSLAPALRSAYPLAPGDRQRVATCGINRRNAGSATDSDLNLWRQAPIWGFMSTTCAVPEQIPVIPFSVLDLSPIIAGGDASLAFRNSLDLAQRAERWGYKRYWLAEHHNMPGIASAATAVVIAHVAGGTRTIRVGSGGIMLPNHAPLVIAEQFGTLESLYPGRIDLGLGRAPGTDMRTAQAMRRYISSADRFPQDVLELQAYFRPAEPGQAVRAVPGAGLDVPIWILGSSLFGAQLAAMLGMPFAFASHFAPADLLDALEIYRREFRPSEKLARPYAMACIAVVAADTDAQARRLFTSLQQQFINLRRGTPGPLPPPVESMEDRWSAVERAGVQHAMSRAQVGSPETVRRGIEAFIRETAVDELMVAGQIFDHQARLRSFEIVASIHAAMAGEETAVSAA
jgi:luciferase family oxidoreductase group 1